MNKKIIDISLVPFKFNRFLTKDIVSEYLYYAKKNNMCQPPLNKYNTLKETFETDNTIFLNIMDQKGEQICKNNNLKVKEMKHILFNLALPS